MKYIVPIWDHSRTIPGWDVPVREINSDKGSAGASKRLCNRLLDVIVSDKVRSQRSFQSPALFQNRKSVTHHSWVCCRSVYHTSGPLRAFVMSSHVAVTIFTPSLSACMAVCAHRLLGLTQQL